MPFQTRIQVFSRKATGTSQMGAEIHAPERIRNKLLYLYAVEAYNDDGDASITIYLEDTYRGTEQCALVPTTDTIENAGCGWTGKIPFEKPMALRAAFTGHSTGDILILKAVMGE